jgi:hypothetical protein
MQRKPLFDGKLYLESKHKSLLNPVLYKKAIYHFGCDRLKDEGVINFKHKFTFSVPRSVGGRKINITFSSKTPFFFFLSFAFRF